MKKEVVHRKIFECLHRVEGVLSTTIVGSFVDKDDLSQISDIDTIVICRELNEAIFNACVTEISTLKSEDLGFQGRELYVNSTFGPLKFDSEGQIVVHLMIYDVEGHRQHVLKSPFTCYDWERSTVFAGQSLKTIYPVVKLQPRDFTSARRGLQNYLDDIERGVISYRRYSFDGDEVEEVLEYKDLDARHQGEYAYHIVKNLVANYCKMVLQESCLLNDEDLYENWRQWLPDCTYFIPFYEKLKGIKLNRGLCFPEETMPSVREFILRFEQNFNRVWGKALQVDFYRHGKTSLNDGSFLGQGRDPSLEQEINPAEGDYSVVIASPALRCRETAERLVPGKEFETDDRLLEINYGEAEGLKFTELRSRFPETVESWAAGEDPRFPNGENTADVRARLESFLAEITKKAGHLIVVSHNVVLRCLLGLFWDISEGDWFKIAIPHARCIEVLYCNDRFYLNVDRDLKGIITDSTL